MTKICSSDIWDIENYILQKQVIKEKFSYFQTMDYKTMKVVTVLIIFFGITQVKPEAQQVTVEVIESNFEAGNPQALEKAIELQDLMQKLGSGDCLGTLRRIELSKTGGECRQMAASQTIQSHYT